MVHHPASQLPLRSYLISWSAVRLVVYYFLLYFFTVVYNIANKRVLNAIPLPATVAVVQLFLGIPLFLPLWFMKPPGNLLQSHSPVPLMQVSVAHALGNLATIYSLGSGAVSFTHVVKSAEPVFSAVLTGLIMRSVLAPQVYLSLLPIVIGVAMASATELTFSWFGFTTAMISNLFYQLRIVWSKQLITGSNSSNNGNMIGAESKISGSNLFRLITIIAAFFLLPIALFLEGGMILPVWRAAEADPTLGWSLIGDILVSGVAYYLYNEIAFWILDLVHPVTHAVGNTIKRVVLIVASVLVFRVPITLQGETGSAIAIAGSLLYGLASHKYGSKA